MKPIVKQVKELIEAAEPDVTVVEINDGPFACPIRVELWEEYLRRNPDGLTVPPTNGRGIKDPELLPYLKHVGSCKECSGV
jgi:hypothetical protein